MTELHLSATMTITPVVAAWLWRDAQSSTHRARKAGIPMPDEVVRAIGQLAILARMSEDRPEGAPLSPAESPRGDKRLAAEGLGNANLQGEELCAREAAKALGMTARHLTRLASGDEDRPPAIRSRRLNGDSGPYLFQRDHLAAFAAQRKTPTT